MAEFAANTMNDLSAKVCAWYSSCGVKVVCEVVGGDIDTTTPVQPYVAMPTLALKSDDEMANIAVKPTYDLMLMTPDERKAARRKGDLYHCTISSSDWTLRPHVNPYLARA